MAATIDQLIPAPGWIVVYEANGVKEEYPLACWVLVKDSTQTPDYHLQGGYINEDTGTIVLCENQPNFKTYKLRTGIVTTGSRQ